MHLQASVEDFDVFVRSLSIGAETMVMRYDPSVPLHARYEVSHDFLTPEIGAEVVAISRLVNAFFRWEFNSCETLVKDGVVYPIDYANASPDVALTSLHYYFPWAMAALVRWCTFCTVVRRPMRINQNTRTYFDDRRPRRPLLRGEARRVPRPRRGLLRRRRLPRVLRRAPPPSRRGRPRVRREPGVRRPARRDGAADVPGARARALRRALPWAPRLMGERPARHGRDLDSGRELRAHRRAAPDPGHRPRLRGRARPAGRRRERHRPPPRHGRDRGDGRARDPRDRHPGGVRRRRASTTSPRRSPARRSSAARRPSGR